MFEIAVEEFWESEGPGAAEPQEFGRYETLDEARKALPDAVKEAKEEAWRRWRDDMGVRLRILKGEDDYHVLVSTWELDADGEYVGCTPLEPAEVSVRDDIYLTLDD